MEKFNKLTSHQVVNALTEMSRKWTKGMLVHYINQSYYYKFTISTNKYSKERLVLIFNRAMRTNSKCVELIFQDNDILKALVVMHYTLYNKQYN